MMRILAFVALIVSLSACQVFGGGDSGGGGGVEDSGANSSIQWDRSANTVVFRAEIAGGEGEEHFPARNEVPLCTIFGDNRIVWTVSSGMNDSQVLYDRLTDAQVRSFISALTVDERVFTYEAGADEQLPSSTEPVVETITVFVNGEEHKTDAFNGEWPPNYFEDILTLCRSQSQGPVEYRPDAAWVSAREVTFSSAVPSVIWDGQAAGLVLAELAASGERRWVTDRNVPLLWRLLHKTALDLQFAEGDKVYQVAVEVPALNKYAPPAPAD